MVKFLNIIILVFCFIPSYAESFYKWRDKSGVIHITDYKPDGVEIINEDSNKGFNKIKSNNNSIQQQYRLDNLKKESSSSEELNLKKYLDSSITNARNEYEFCVRDLNSRMTPRSAKDKSEHRGRKKMCESLFAHYKYLLSLTNADEYLVSPEKQTNILK